MPRGRLPFKDWEDREGLQPHPSISVESGPEAEYELCTLLTGLSHGALSTDVWTNVLHEE